MKFYTFSNEVRNLKSTNSLGFCFFCGQATIYRAFCRILYKHVYIIHVEPIGFPETILFTFTSNRI